MAYVCFPRSEALRDALGINGTISQG
jgi:hypothetical protein